MSVTNKLPRQQRLCGLMLMICTMTGCGSSDSQPEKLPTSGTGTVVIVPPTLPAGPKLPVPDNRTVNDFQVLMYGNSHVATNDLPGLVARLLRIGRPNANVYAVDADGWGYLDERFQDGTSLLQLQSKKWSHVILQGQKYSTTGLYSYSTSEAELWIALIKKQQATPILFPEHATVNNFEEGARVYQLHQSIATEEPACVAPVPLAWTMILNYYPEIKLHVSDGNHANENGSVLTAMLFYQIITGDPADQLPFIAGLGVDASTQQLLRQQASATLQQHPACPF